MNEHDPQLQVSWERPPQRPRDVLFLDIRSLALLRICYGLILLFDLLIRAQDLYAHYTDLGVLPRDVLLQLSANQAWISLHMMNGTWQFQAVVFVVNALLALTLIVGYRTRLVTVLCWFFLISLHSRNPMVLNGGDVYLRAILFWAMFLPWGACWSIDSVLDARTWRMPVRVSSAATMAYTLQVCFVYWFAAIPKWDPKWTVEYTAAYYALQVDQFTTPWGYVLLRHPELLKAATFGVWWFEALGPFLFLVPLAIGPLRTLGVVGIMGLHLGFLTAMRLGMFGWIGFTSATGLLPTWFWDRLLKGRVDRAMTALFIRLAAWLVPEQFAERPSNPGVARPLRPALPVPVNLFLVGLVAYVLTWNAGNEGVLGLSVPERLNWVGHLFRIDQRWNMFSPGPLTQDGWYVIEAVTRDGRRIDLYRHGAEVNWDKPAEVSRTYPNARWRKYMMNLWLAENEAHRNHYGRFLCREWNRTHGSGDQVMTFKIFYMLEETRPDYEPSAPQKVMIWEHWCFKSPQG